MATGQAEALPSPALLARKLPQTGRTQQPVAKSTPIQPSPLRAALAAIGKPVQPTLPEEQIPEVPTTLPEEQTPEVPRWPQQPKQLHSPIRSTPSKPSVNSNSNPSLSHYSEGSLNEYFLKNINSNFCNKAPLLIEEKLKVFCSNFMSELSGTMGSFPGT
jgi:hypothetical protein